MSDKLGATLRNLRKNKGYTVREVSRYLISKGFKASEKTVYSWENGNSDPSPDALLSLCELYKVANVLDEFGYSQSVPNVTSYEFEYVQKIRMLDKYGHKAVMETIDREFNRCTEQKLRSEDSTA